MIGVERALCRSVPRALNSDKRNLLPRSGLLAYIKDGVYTIGVSIAEIYAAVPAAHKSIYSADGVTFYDLATIITNIAASVYLNDGGELAGNATKGYVQYIDGTTEAILRRVYRYLGETYPEIEQAVNPDLSPAYNPDDSPMYNPA